MSKTDNKNQNGILFFLDWLPLINSLSDENRLKFYDLIFAKNYQEIEKITDKHLRSILDFVLKRMEENGKKYAERCAKARDSALLRWHPNASDGMRINANAKNAMHHDTDHDHKTDTDHENDPDKNLYVDFCKIYKIFYSEKNIRTFPFKKLKSRFNAALKAIGGMEILEKQVTDYLQYLITADWRAKKEFGAWLGENGGYANDWVAELATERKKAAGNAKKTPGEEWGEIINEFDEKIAESQKTVQPTMRTIES